MANTITNTRLTCSKKSVIQEIAIASDGSEETDLVIYDSSVVATANGLADPLNCKIRKIKFSGNAASGLIALEFDASTDILAYAFKGDITTEIDFMKMGGLRNMAGSGITGDITLTTAGLSSGDAFVITLEVDPKYSSY